jgi:uncharacterized protein (TIGR00251 family)
MLKGIRPGNGGVLIDLQVTPGARKTGIRYDPDLGRLKVKVSAQAEKGKANSAVLETLEEVFGRCELVSGSLTHRKTVLVRDGKLQEIEGLIKKMMIFID